MFSMARASTEKLRLCGPRSYPSLIATPASSAGARRGCQGAGIDVTNQHVPITSRTGVSHLAGLNTSRAMTVRAPRRMRALHAPAAGRGRIGVAIERLGYRHKLD